MKYLLIIHDSGTYNLITATRIVEDDFVVDPELYLAVPMDIYDQVNELLIKNKVMYPDTVETLQLSDLIVDTYTAIDLAKIRARTRAKNQIAQRIDPLAMFEFVNFTVLNNELLNAGFIITDDNREEKYLEIINTGDEILIDKLESYLNSKDNLSESIYWHSKWMDFKSVVDNATDENVVNDAVNSLLELFK